MNRLKKALAVAMCSKLALAQAVGLFTITAPFVISTPARATCPPSFTIGTIASDADCIWRDYYTDGASGSGKWNPYKPDIRHWGETVGAATAAVGVTPQQYGAKCDGVTDDASALQSWLNALGTTGVSASPVYSGQLTGGTCLYKSGLTVSGNNAISIRGQGPNSQLRYAGASPSTTGILFGTTTGGCSVSSVTLEDFLFSSATTMIAGAAMEFDDVCGLRVQNVLFEDNAGGVAGNWANGVIEKGGNQHYFINDTLTGSINVVYMLGDDVAHGSTQLTDPRFIGGIIYGGYAGVHIAGNVGGFSIDGTDVLGNTKELLIDQSGVALPNGQIFVGPTTYLDSTKSVASGVDIDVEDAGGGNSLLTVNSAWVAGAYASCVVFASGVHWSVNWTGGWIVNCGNDGITNASTNVVGSIKDVTVAMQAGGYLGGTGYDFSCLVVNYSFKIINPTILTSNASGQFSSNCVSTNQTITVPNGSSVAIAGGQATQYTVKNVANQDAANYTCGAGSCTLGTAIPGTAWVTPTTSPASGKLSVQGSSGTYNVYNNTGASVTVALTMSN